MIETLKYVYNKFNTDEVKNIFITGSNDEGKTLLLKSMFLKNGGINFKEHDFLEDCFTGNLTEIFEDKGNFFISQEELKVVNPCEKIELKHFKSLKTSDDMKSEIINKCIYEVENNPELKIYLDSFFNRLEVSSFEKYSSGIFDMKGIYSFLLCNSDKIDKLYLDEIDKSIYPKIVGEFYRNLFFEFPNIKFVIVTHNATHVLSNFFRNEVIHIHIDGGEITKPTKFIGASEFFIDNKLIMSFNNPFEKEQNYLKKYLKTRKQEDYELAKCAKNRIMDSVDELSDFIEVGRYEVYILISEFLEVESELQF